jgi:hypothetical protein
VEKRKKSEVSLPELSLSELAGFRLQLMSGQLEYWRRRQLKAPAEQPTDKPDWHPGDDASGLVWISRDRKWCPYLTVNSYNTQQPRVDLPKAYLKAVKGNDPSLIAHHALRVARRDNMHRVLRFFETFGVLTDPDHDLLDDPPSPVPSGQFSGGYWINLDAFWREQAWFAAVYHIWEASADPERLRETWLELFSEIDFDSDSRAESFRKLWLSRDRVLSPLKHWIPSASDEALRQFSDLFVLQTVSDATSGLERSWSRHKRSDGLLALRLQVQPKTLISAIWEFFAYDTDNGLIARICPHCGDVFFPPRVDRLYCSAELQQLYLKRKWARDHQRQLNIKRRARRAIQKNKPRR